MERRAPEGSLLQKLYGFTPESWTCTREMSAQKDLYVVRPSEAFSPIRGSHAALEDLKAMLQRKRCRIPDAQKHADITSIHLSPRPSAHLFTQFSELPERSGTSAGNPFAEARPVTDPATGASHRAPHSAPLAPAGAASPQHPSQSAAVGRRRFAPPKGRHPQIRSCS